MLSEQDIREIEDLARAGAADLTDWRTVLEVLERGVSALAAELRLLRAEYDKLLSEHEDEALAFAEEMSGTYPEDQRRIREEMRERRRRVLGGDACNDEG